MTPDKLKSKSDRAKRRGENAAFQEQVRLAACGLTPIGPVETPKPRTPVRRRKKKAPARKAAFQRLVRACKAFVFARNRAKNGGLCEIGLAKGCGGMLPANTWYHGWPQKGGNGLKYDVRSHFASCGHCNMGEYGARYRGDDSYRNRHKYLLGNLLHAELSAAHGRRQISTVEARELAERLEAWTRDGDFLSVYGNVIQTSEGGRGE